MKCDQLVISERNKRVAVRYPLLLFFLRYASTASALFIYLTLAVNIANFFKTVQ